MINQTEIQMLSEAIEKLRKETDGLVLKRDKLTVEAAIELSRERNHRINVAIYGSFTSIINLKSELGLVDWVENSSIYKGYDLNGKGWKVHVFRRDWLV